MRVHIIAEAGSNYNGSVSLAKQLNSVAAAAKADSVKYQIIYPEGLYRPGKYAYGHYDIGEVSPAIILTTLCSRKEITFS